MNGKDPAFFVGHGDEFNNEWVWKQELIVPPGRYELTVIHGDPEVWHRLLGAITAGGLYLTGSWPAKTEAGGRAGSANIVTTLTLSCRPAPANRPPGRVDDVDDEVRREVRARGR